MKLFSSLLIATAVVAAPLYVRADSTRTVEKTFAVSADGLLRVQTFGGNVVVEAIEGNEVKVLATEKVSTNSTEKAEKIFNQIKLTVEQKGNDVAAVAEFSEGMGFHFTKAYPSVSFKISVPKHYRVDLTTSGGNIELSSLVGDAKVETSGGELRLARIDGKIYGRTSGGSIRIEEGTGTVDLATSGGNVHAKRTGSSAKLETSGGSIEVESAAGPVFATTSGGNVRATFEGAIKGDCVLETSGGNVEVTVDKSSAFFLEAGTSGGSVKAKGLVIELDGRGDSEHLSGKVNGGGPKLKLGTSGGDVRVQVR